MRAVLMYFVVDRLLSGDEPTIMFVEGFRLPVQTCISERWQIEMQVLDPPESLPGRPKPYPMTRRAWTDLKPLGMRKVPAVVALAWRGPCG